ncbi:acyl-CoA thioesterase [Shimazuella alba]|uniref:YbgC/FadM family acyl-CoA thioesterase n=1 Tax=Shimazuella alba TaxID=2690964 RepID=A0A6I4VVP1_9BACL|nr:thioesterase family protein [Shimazuella alba]MXQ53906.1 YbgC/FadM family acyl-CoA thioesterase [Shimazuella alba]
MEVCLSIEVRSTEIDVMGHVNNAKYLEYLEWGREEWYNQVKLPFDEFKAMGVGTVTVSIHIQYRKEAKQGDRLTIQTKPLRCGKSSFVFFQEIKNEKGEVVADAEVISVTIDLENRKSKPLPELLRRYFD